MIEASEQRLRLRDAERMVWIRSRLTATRGDDVRLRSLLVAVHELLERRLAAEVGSAPPLSDLVAEPCEAISDYAAFVEQVRSAAEAEVPDGAQVLVVSRGDSDLLRLKGRTTGHFPQGRSGEWAGFYPLDGRAAVDHLEDLLREGYEFLVFPASSRWWLAYYRELAAFLAERGRLVHHGPACTIFAPGVESLGEAAA
jgi:hypothetical protein